MVIGEGAECEENMNITISNTSNAAIYEQIVAQVKDGIIRKELQADEPLPSIRALARDLQISVITTKRAYEQLEAEGLIYSQPGKGFYVSQSKTAILKEKRVQGLEEQMADLVKQCKNAELTKEEIIGLIEVLYDE